MKEVKIYRSPRPLNERKDLKIIIRVGEHGFKRTEVLKKGKWKVGQSIWVDEDYTSIEFEDGP